MKATTARIAACLLALGATGAGAQDRYPSRPITIINPNAPGGIVDLVIRGLTNPLQKVLKQPVTVVNRGGAAGAIGHAAVANAPADGYTLLVTTPALATIPATDEVFGRASTYSLSQFVPLAQLNSDPTMLIVHPSLPVKTGKEFVALAKARPADVIITSSGTYGSTHLPMAMLEAATGIKLRHIPTTGGGPAMTNTLGGHATALAAAPGVAYPHVKSNRLRAAAHWGAKRIAAFPDVATFKENGIDVEYYIWTTMFAHSKTPPAVLKTLQDAVRVAVQDDDFKTSMSKINAPIGHLDGDALVALFQQDVKKLQETVKRIGKVEDGK